MPLSQPVRYRFKKGTNIRLAFVKGTNKVIEAKNTKTGATHTPAEFAADRKKGLKHMMTKPGMMK